MSVTKEEITVTTGTETALVFNVEGDTGKNGISVSTFKSDYLANVEDYIKIFKEDGVTEMKSGTVGTGCIVRLYDGTSSTAVIKEQAVIIVKGDVNGDGKIKAVDAKMTLDVASQTATFTDYKALAANVDGKTGIKAVDAKKILDRASGTLAVF